VASKKFTFSSVLMAGPVNAGTVGMSVRQNVGFESIYQHEDSDLIALNSTDLSPFILLSSVVANAKIIAIRVISAASVKVKLTGSAGADQAVTISGPEGSLVLNSPNDGYTAIKLVGVADVEYLVAG
jgi:hypothetical protein